MAMELARECGPHGRPIPGTKGLTLFFVPVRRDAQGSPEVGGRMGGAAVGGDSERRLSRVPPVAMPAAWLGVGSASGGGAGHLSQPVL